MAEPRPWLLTTVKRVADPDIVGKFQSPSTATAFDLVRGPVCVKKVIRRGLTRLQITSSRIFAAAK